MNENECRQKIKNLFFDAEQIKCIGDTGRKDTFYLRKGINKYFVKIFTQNEFGKVRNQNKVLSHMQNYSIQTPQVFECYNFQDGYLASYRPWVEGNVLKKINLEQAIELSHFISLLHLHEKTKVNKWHYNNLEDINDPKWIFISKQIKNTNIKLLCFLFNKTISLIENNINLIKDVYGKRSLVHGDLKPSNMIKTKNGLVVIDWDFSGAGLSIFDLALTNLHYSFGNSSVKEEWYDNTLIKLYSERIKISSQGVFRIVQKIAGLSYFLQDVAMYAYIKSNQTAVNPIERSHYFFNWCLPEFERFYCEVFESGSDTTIDFKEMKRCLSNLV